MQAFKHIKTGVVHTEPHWINYLMFLQDDKSFNDYLKEGLFIPVFLEVNSYKIGKPEQNGIEWTAYARGEDDIEYMLFEFAPAGELAKWTEESVDLIEEV